MKNKKLITKLIVGAVIVLGLWILIPIVVRGIKLQSIKSDIKSVEKRIESLNEDISLLSAERQKCEDLQLTANEQAAGKRGEIEKLNNEIIILKTEYNNIGGFIQASQ